MNELIAINSGTIGGETVQTVNARDLHSFLESRQDFTTWIKARIDQYGFIEGADYLLHKTGEQLPSGTKYRNDYHVSIDMGKELAMVERNAKGKEARLYFIECEKRALSLAIPQTFAEALQLAANQAKQLEEQGRVLIEMAPKAEFFDAVTDSTDAVDIGTVAKVLNCGIGRTRLFQFLRDEKVLMATNQPYQNYVDCGYFRVIESKYSKPDGSSHINFKTVVYQKGVEFIRKRLKAKGVTRD